MRIASHKIALADLSKCAASLLGFSVLLKRRLAGKMDARNDQIRLVPVLSKLAKTKSK